MPALHLSNLFRRNAARPSLGQRAASLKASLGQVRARPASLPKPGSEEAKAAFKAACHEHTIRTQFANEYPDLKRTPLEWWTSDSLGKAMETGEITPAECALLYPRATERELRMREIEHELNLGALHALAFADSYPVPSSEDDADEPEEDVSNDAELIRLGHLFEAARIEEVAACEACNAAGREADRLAPQRPAALTLRASDHPLSVYQWHTHPSALEGIELRAGDIEWLRGRMPMKHEVLRPIRDGERAHVDHPGHRFDIVPHPEAQARAEEIIAAWDLWQAEKTRIYQEHLTRELEDAADETGDLTLHLATQIANLSARTAEGFRVKLRALVHYRHDALLAELPSEPDPDQVLYHSLWRDMQESASPAVAVGRADDLSDAILNGWAAWGAVQDIHDDDVQDEADARRRDLIHKAMALPATPYSITAKALACAWMEWVETERPGQPRDAYGKADQLAYDLHAAIMARGVTGEAVKPQHADLLGAAGLSVEKLPVFDLCSMLEAAETLSDVAAAITCQPGQMTKGNFNGAGRLIESTAFALHGAIDVVAKELRLRTPDNASDRIERLVALARLTIHNDDPAQTTAFARELLATVEP